MRVQRRAAVVLLVAATALMVSGCSGGSSGATTATTATIEPTVSVSAPANGVATATPSPPASPAPATPESSCGPSSGEDAAADAIAGLALPPGLEDARWDAAGADYSGYDPCAALSWSVVSLEMATGSSPCAILLFHEGVYLGTATAQQYGFVPGVERTAPGAILVTYRYVQADESTADASGRAVATFTWNPDTARVDMAGDTPPAR